MLLSKQTAQEALRHYQSPGQESSAFLIDFLKSCVVWFEGYIPPNTEDKEAHRKEVEEAARRGYSGT